VGSEVQVLSNRKNIYLFSLKKRARKNPETVVVSGLSGAISFLVAQYGPSGDNGFDQTPIKPSIYGTCAHFSSKDQKQNRIIYRNPPLRYNGIAKEDFHI